MDTVLSKLGGAEEDFPDSGQNVPISEVGVNTEEAVSLARESMDFLAGLALPTMFSFFFPAVFKQVWNWLRGYAHKVRVFPKLALGLPRGFGKTTVIKLFVLYCILFTQKRFILVICARAGLAENIISDVIDMLEELNIKRLFGDWRLSVTKDTQDVKKFGYRGRNITLVALGAGSSMRGINLRNDRPDVMIFDDIQTKECAESKIQSEALESWMIGTAMKAKSPFGCMFLFIGNMYPTQYSILRKLKHNPVWTKFIVGGILSDGTSLWEELQPIVQLIEEFQNDLAMGHPEIFYAEVLNDENASSNSLIDLNELPEFPVQEGDIAAGKFIVIDPSNDKINSDAVAIGYFEVHEVRPSLMEVEEDSLSPLETIRVAITMGLKNNCRVIFVEGNAYQYSLLFWFEHVCKQLSISGFSFIPIYSGSRAKTSRILDWFKAYAKGECFVHPRARAQVHAQILDFKPLKKDNVDGILDLMTYSIRIVNEFGPEIVVSNLLDDEDHLDDEIILFNTSF